MSAAALGGRINQAGHDFRGVIPNLVFQFFPQFRQRDARSFSACVELFFVGSADDALAAFFTLEFDDARAISLKKRRARLSARPQ